MITLGPCDVAQINRTLSSDISNLCPGDYVTFTCTTLCSNILGWGSEEYIGTGGNYIEVLTSSDMIITHNFNGRVTASRIDRNQINATCTNIIAQLNFTVLENIHRNCNDSIKFHVSCKFNLFMV